MKNSILVFVFALTVQLSAQTRTITGVVTDATHTPIPGVNVIVKGAANGTQTNFDGLYSISANEGQTLVFTYIGYKTEEVKIGKVNIINVQLEEDAAMLEEVVVTGYGIKRESKSLSYSVSEVVEGKVSGIEVIGGVSKGKIISDGNFKSGTLTAGEINDIENFDDWNKIFKQKDFRKIQDDWGFYLENKLEVNIQNLEGEPVPNALVRLYGDSRENSGLVMTTRTDAFGNAILFTDFNNRDIDEFYYIQVSHNSIIKGKKIRPNKSREVFELDVNTQSNNLDIMFTIDATGSMGDEMDYLKEELRDIVQRVDSKVGKKRVALTFYRDQGDSYVVRDFDFSDDIACVQSNLADQNANGGGDFEEAVEKALEVAMLQSWNVEARTKLMFLLLDAPPHLNPDNVKVIQQQIRIAQEKGIKIIPIVASGADKTLEILTRFFSVSTNGTYVFLTDDSGIGNPHLEPTTPRYTVEKLNDLIVRLIDKYSGNQII